MKEFAPCIIPEDVTPGKDGWLRGVWKETAEPIVVRVFTADVRIETNDQNFDVVPNQVVVLSGEARAAVELLSLDEARESVCLVVWPDTFPPTEFKTVNGKSRSTGAPRSREALELQLPAVLVDEEHEVTVEDLTKALSAGTFLLRYEGRLIPLSATGYADCGYTPA